MARNITIISTSTGGDYRIISSARTWRDLKKEINHMYDLNALKATEATNKTTLDYEDSVLPEGDFELYLRPSKTNSGQ